MNRVWRVFITAFFLPGSLSLFAASTSREAHPKTGGNPVVGLHGQITWHVLVRGQRTGTNKASRFSVVLDGCKYRLDETNAWNGLAQSFVHDGTNWFSQTFPPGNYTATNVTHFTVDGPVPTQLETPRKPMPSLRVSPVIEPMLPNITSLLPVWLAFGSGCHFALEDNHEIPAMFFMIPGPHSQIVLLRADRSLKTDGGLVRYVDYWDEQLFRPAQPSATGLTNIAFHVTAWTNIGNLNVPLTFRFVRYFFSPDDKPQYYQSMDGTGQVETIERLVRSVPLTPSIAPNTHVVHYRSHSWEPATYSTKDGRLKSQDEVDALTR